VLPELVVVEVEALTQLVARAVRAAAVQLGLLTQTEQTEQ
jgi:hypothetical protein